MNEGGQQQREEHLFLCLFEPQSITEKINASQRGSLLESWHGLAPNEFQLWREVESSLGLKVIWVRLGLSWTFCEKRMPTKRDHAK